jgi:hypothetical protein
MTNKNTRKDKQREKEQNTKITTAYLKSKGISKHIHNIFFNEMRSTKRDNVVGLAIIDDFG